MANTAIAFTEFTVVATDSTYRLPGDVTAAQIVSNYSASISGLANMEATERTETRSDGVYRVITFRNRTGNKG